MTTLEVQMPPLHPGQMLVHRHPARFKVLCCGRRWGKTQFAAAKAFEAAAAGGIAWWVAPTYDVGTMGWRKIERLAKQIPGSVIKQSDREIHLPSGGMVVIRSADGQRSLRGEGISRLIVDETADVPRDRWQADLRPALSDKQGDAIFIGTPKGRANWFYDLFSRGQDATRPTWMSWQMSTYTNPFVSNEEIDEAKKDMPEWLFRQEYLAEFVAFQGRVYKMFDPAGPWGFEDVDLARYHTFFGGIDPGFNNPCAIGVAGHTADDQLDLLEEVYERGMTDEAIIRVVKDMTARYGVKMWWSDPSDPGLIAALQNAGIPARPAPRAAGPFDSWVKNGIIEVEKRLISKPPRLRFHRKRCPMVIRDFDNYRYPQQREGAPEKEMPLKVDDHGCDMVRYIVVGMNEWYGVADGMPTGYGRRETA